MHINDIHGHANVIHDRQPHVPIETLVLMSSEVELKVLNRASRTLPYTNLKKSRTEKKPGY